MPHNLYLHSALVQSRRIARTPAGIQSGIRFNLIDSVVALNGAFFVNAALLVMAAATFYRAGYHEVADIDDAHRLLEPILGASLAPIAFAVALIAAGQSSTITGTLAGQIVMEGFLQLRLRPIVRRLLTRAVAIIAGAGRDHLVRRARPPASLLVLSQVVLSLQLSFAVIPLIHLDLGRPLDRPLRHQAGRPGRGLGGRRGDRVAQPQAGQRGDHRLDRRRRATPPGSSG